jgi:hypothetical protein
VPITLATAPYVLAPSTTSTRVTPSFTPAAGEVLVAKVVQWQGTTTISGGGLTWQLRASGTAANKAPVFIYTAVVPAGQASMTVTATKAGTTGTHALVVERWLGAELAATPATNTVKVGASTTAISTTLTSVGTNSIVTWCCTDWNEPAVTSTVYRSSATEEQKFLQTGEYSAWQAYQASPTTGTVTFGVSTPSTGDWQMVGIEILEAAAAPPPAGGIAPPVFVAHYGGGAYATVASKTATVTAQVGDTLVCWGSTAVHDRLLTTPTGGTGLTWTLRQSIVGITDFCNVYIWTAPVTVALTNAVITVGSSGPNDWTMGVERWSGVGGIAASPPKANSATGTPSLAITTTKDDSAIVWHNADWVPVNGSGRVYRLPSGSTAAVETFYEFMGSITGYQVRHADAGPAGAKTVGMTAPTGQKWSIIALELLGTSTGVTAALSGSGSLTDGATAPSMIQSGGLSSDGTLTAVTRPEITRESLPDLSGSGTLTATGRPVVAQAAALGGAGTLAAAAAARAIQTALLSGTGTLAGVVNGAILSGSGTLTAVPRPLQARDAQLSGAGTLTSIVVIRPQLSGAGQLTAGQLAAVARAAALSGVGSLTARSASFQQSGVGTLVAVVAGFRFASLSGPVTGVFATDGVHLGVFVSHVGAA